MNSFKKSKRKRVILKVYAKSPKNGAKDTFAQTIFSYGKIIQQLVSSSLWCC